MSHPEVPAEPQDEQPAEVEDTEAVEESEIPLNRAARRAKPVKQAKPGHVGPYTGLPQQNGGSGPRGRTKRPR